MRKISGRALDTKTISLPHHNATHHHNTSISGRTGLGLFTSKKMTTTPLCLPRDEASECMIIKGNEGTGPRIIGGRKMDYRHVQKLPWYSRPIQSIGAYSQTNSKSTISLALQPSATLLVWCGLDSFNLSFRHSPATMPPLYLFSPSGFF